MTRVRAGLKLTQVDSSRPSTLAAREEEKGNVSTKALLVP